MNFRLLANGAKALEKSVHAANEMWHVNDRPGAQSRCREIVQDCETLLQQAKLLLASLEDESA